MTVPRNKDNTTTSSQMFDLSPDITIKYIWKKVRIKQVYYFFLIYGAETRNETYCNNIWMKTLVVFQMREPTPFIVVMKTIEDGFSRYREIKDAGKAGSLVYHRLDLLPTDNTCMHLKQLATMGTLFNGNMLQLHFKQFLMLKNSSTCFVANIALNIMFIVYR